MTVNLGFSDGFFIHLSERQSKREEETDGHYNWVRGSPKPGDEVSALWAVGRQGRDASRGSKVTAILFPNTEHREQIWSPLASLTAPPTASLTFSTAKVRPRRAQASQKGRPWL